MDAEWTDIAVIGTGPGGEDAAGKLAEAGLRVTGVKANLVGGECPYWGCVPSKMMIRAGNLLAEEACSVPEITQGNQPVLPYPGPGRLRQVITTRTGRA